MLELWPKKETKIGKNAKLVSRKKLNLIMTILKSKIALEKIARDSETSYQSLHYWKQKFLEAGKKESSGNGKSPWERNLKRELDEASKLFWKRRSRKITVL